MLTVVRRLFDHSIFKFGIVGCINTLSGLSIIYLCKLCLNLGDVISNFIGYSVGLCISFYLNSRWTFKYKGMKMQTIIKFGAVTIVAYLLNLLSVMILINNFNLDGNFAQPLGILPYITFFYMGCRFWVFPEN